MKITDIIYLTSALCLNLVELLHDLNQGDKANEVSEHNLNS